MKRSIRRKVTGAFLAVVASAMLLLILLNYIFLPHYYSYEKMHILEKSFNMLDVDTAYSDEQLRDLAYYCANNNLYFIVARSDFSLVAYNVNHPETLATRVFIYSQMPDNDALSGENAELIKQSKNYQIHQIKDTSTSVSYMELLGKMANGDYFVVRCSIEGIQNGATISNRFFAVTAPVLLVAGFIVIWFLMKRMLRPLSELTDLSKRMATLDFDAKYKSGGDDEVGTLGKNFNLMSDTLEHTITKLKTANNELQKDISKKIENEEMRQEFLSNVTHELKTPLALIQGYAEGLRDGINEGDQESNDFYCDVIIDEALKMNEMVKKLLVLNQLESGNDQVVMERFNLTELIGGVISSSQIIIEQKQAEVIFDADTPVYVWADEFKVEEIITNFLTNALNHLEGEHKVKITMQTEEGAVRTTVFNTGRPIPEEDLGKVWEKFFKVDKARTRAYGGSGIGLSIVKAIVDSFNQKCGADNYENGVAFWFTLESDANRASAS